VIRAVDIVELRTAANEMRAAAGLGAYSFTDSSLAGTPMRAIHVNELRTAINQARAALDLPAVSYTDPTLTVGTTKIKAAHINELKEAARVTYPSSKNGRHVKMMSPTHGETFWTPTTSLRLIAQGFDPNVFTNHPVPGKGQNAAQVAFYVDDTLLFTMSGADAEYSVFKGTVNDVALAPGEHSVWARATYVDPPLILDSVPSIKTGRSTHKRSI
jgi:hypothetical protein